MIASPENGGVNMLKIAESVENYLETILVLGKDENPVRSIDVANKLGFSKPSVSVAMKNLRQSGYITVDGQGYINLTSSGKSVAQKVYDRHTLISGWLISLGVDKQTATDDACKMEHGMSEASFVAIKNHIDEWQGVKSRVEALKKMRGGD